MRSAVFLQRFSGVGPVERVRHRGVVVGDELSELRFQFGHRFEVAAAQTFSLEDAEEDFDLVQPRAVFRQVDEADAVRCVREEFAAVGQGLQDAAGVFFPARRSRRSAERPV